MGIPTLLLYFINISLSKTVEILGNKSHTVAHVHEENGRNNGTMAKNDRNGRFCTFSKAQVRFLL